MGRILQKKMSGGSSAGTAGCGGNEKTKKTAAACLGVIRLHYDYPPAPGDTDHFPSFSCDVYYKVVPGLRFEMCQKGKMTDEVKERF